MTMTMTIIAIAMNRDATDTITMAATIAARTTDGLGPTTIMIGKMATAVPSVTVMTMTDVGKSGPVLEAGRHSAKSGSLGSIQAMTRTLRGTGALCPGMLGEEGRLLNS